MIIPTHVVRLDVSAGLIELELFGHQAPVTVKNFLELALGEREWTDPETGKVTNRPLYTGTVFHRVIPDFMIQGGDPQGTGMGGPGYTFDDEIHPELAFSEPYLLAMANSGKRGGHGTNGSQFFITQVPTPWLQGKHTIFGRVRNERSKQVVDAVANSPRDSRDNPLEPVFIERVEIDPA